MRRFGTILRSGAMMAAAMVLAGGTAAAQRTRHSSRSAGGAAADPPTTVILVRHAEKVTNNPFDRNPSLSPAGRERARVLARELAGRHVDAVIVTNLLRTQMTAQPFVDARHITPDTVPMVDNGDSTAQAIARLIRTRYRGKTVLVVGHNTLVPRTIAALGGPRLDDICESAYSNLFTMVIPSTGTPRLSHTHYGAPDPAAHHCVNGIHAEENEHAGSH